MLSFVTLLAPPDPAQLKEQPFPPGQEYCHSEAISNPLGWDGPAPMRPSSCAGRDCEGQPTNRAAPTTSAQKPLDAIHPRSSLSIQKLSIHKLELPKNATVTRPSSLCHFSN